MGESLTQVVSRRHEGNKVVTRERAYDYLYDPDYTVSSEVDHARSHLKAYGSTSRMRRVPVYGSMFSDLPHHPRYTLRLDSSDPVPPTVDRRWRGRIEEQREAFPQLAGIFPTLKLKQQRKDHLVTGADRWKYFDFGKRPSVPLSQHINPDDRLAFPLDDFKHTGGRKSEQQPTHSTVEVQTDYRESETQTDPYSPEYVLQPGTTPPELLQLPPLSWGRGLPAGRAEVEMIQQARARRAWEATLPPLDDPSQRDKRKRMMKEMETKKWALREREIQKLQDAHLAELKDLLQQREETEKRVANERLNRIYSRLDKEQETRLIKINNDYARAVRKIEAKRRSLQGSRNLTLKSHLNSWTHAAQTSRDAHQNKLQSSNAYRFQGLQTVAPGRKPQGKKTKPREETIQEMFNPSVSQEEQLYLNYKMIREKEKEAKKPPRFLLKKEKPVPRPVTPKVEEPPEGEEEKELAVINLQKLLRGRSVQLKMSKGKEKHLHLIQELRIGQALQAEEQDLLKADKELVLTERNQRDKLRHKASQESAVQAAAVGAELQPFFDTLSKDLIHLQEERRIHAFTLRAERDRRRREAEESGRRQTEDHRRREEDEIFRQVVQVHQETVDLYLEDMIPQTLEQTADQQARDEIHRRAQEVNDIAYAMEESINSLQSEEIVSEMVHSFLIPEVEKIPVRQREHQKQRRHLQAAWRIIQNTAEHSGFLPSTQGASEINCPSERASKQVLEEVIYQEEPKQSEEEK